MSESVALLQTGLSRQINFSQKMGADLVSSTQQAITEKDQWQNKFSSTIASSRDSFETRFSALKERANLTQAETLSMAEAISSNSGAVSQTVEQLSISSANASKQYISSISSFASTHAQQITQLVRQQEVAVEQQSQAITQIQEHNRTATEQNVSSLQSAALETAAALQVNTYDIDDTDDDYVMAHLSFQSQSTALGSISEQVGAFSAAFKVDLPTGVTPARRKFDSHEAILEGYRKVLFQSYLIIVCF